MLTVNASGPSPLNHPRKERSSGGNWRTSRRIDTRHKETAFGPLREPLFRGLWIAAVVCYTGRWMQTVATGWLMTSLTTSPMLVALVQVASSAPAFLLYIPAGATADMFDRRRVLLFTQAWMVVAALALGILTVSHWVTPVWLLVLTLIMGIGAVANDPPWQAITHEVVSEQNFASAVALNSAGFNVARAVGPALSGIVIAAWGTATAFFLNAASMFGVVVFLFRWKRRPHEHALPGKDVLVAIKVGFEYAQHSAAVRSVLIRTGAFSLGASGLWALFPLIARPMAQSDSAPWSDSSASARSSEPPCSPPGGALCPSTQWSPSRRSSMLSPPQSPASHQAL